MKPILAITVGLVLLFLACGSIVFLRLHTGQLTPDGQPTATVDPYPPGTIGYYSEHGNPICALVYTLPDPKHSMALQTVVNLIPYYGKKPSKRWTPGPHEMPRAQATALCLSMGAVLWHLPHAR